MATLPVLRHVVHGANGKQSSWESAEWKDVHLGLHHHAFVKIHYLTLTVSGQRHCVHRLQVVGRCISFDKEIGNADREKVTDIRLYKLDIAYSASVLLDRHTSE